MATRKRIDEQAVNAKMEEATKAGLPDAIFEEEETSVVSDPYMAVQGAPVSPSKTFTASREGDGFDIIAPTEWTTALNVFLQDYGVVDVGWRIGTHKRFRVRVLPIFPSDEVFESVLSMLERMEKLYLSQ